MLAMLDCEEFLPRVPLFAMEALITLLGGAGPAVAPRDGGGGGRGGDGSKLLLP